MDTTSMSNMSDEAESAIDFSMAAALGPTVSLYGNLSSERSKKDIQVSRVAHVRFTRFTLVGEGDPRNLVFAISMLKSRRSLRSTPLDILKDTRTLQLNLTFSFIYTHTLKGPGDQFRVLIQERHKGDFRVLASAPLHMQAVLQCPFAGEISLRAPTSDLGVEGPLYAKVQAVVASYTEDIESPEEAREWEDVLSRPESHFKATAPATLPATVNVTIAAPDDADDEEEREAHSSSLAYRVRSKMKKKLVQRGLTTPNTRFKGIKSLLPKGGQQGHGSVSSDEEREEIREKERRGIAGGYGSGESSARTDSMSDRSDFDFDEAPKPRGEGSPQGADPIPIASPSMPPMMPTLILPTAAVSTLGSNRDDQNLHVLLNPNKRGSKRFQELAERTPELKGTCMEVRNAQDAASVVAMICNKYQQMAEQGPSRAMRIALAGSDKLVHLVGTEFAIHLEVDICAYRGPLLSRRPRGWAATGFSFYLIPLAKRNYLAQHIGAADATYRQLFLGNDWSDLWQRTENGLSITEGCTVQMRVQRYLSEASQAVKFDIGEAWVSFAKAESPAQLQQTVPVIRGVQFGVDVRMEKKEAEIPVPTGEIADLQVDYWPSSAPGGRKDDQQQSMKHTEFQCVALTRLPAVATSLSIDRPLAGSFSLLLQWRERNTTKKLGIGKNSRTCKMHSQSSRAVKVTVASAAPNEVFAIRIDGVELKGVQGVSVSMQFAGALKALPIVSFTAPPLTPST